LGRLSPKAGAELLARLGAKGTDAVRQHLADAVRGHALTLTLLGNYLREAYQGEIARVDEAKLLDQDAADGGHAWRVLESYKTWFENNGRLVELGIMRLIGFFNRPADEATLNALRARPKVAGLNDDVCDAGKEVWQRAISRLRDMGLLGDAVSADDALDAHPLVRDDFAQSLTSTPAVLREGHARIYEHLKRTSSPLPSRVEEMIPWYHAVTHGCAAGLVEDTFSNVYWKLIQRKSEYFAVKVLGMVGADLSALACFFEEAWNRVRSDLSERACVTLLDEAGEALHAQGRLSEAREAMSTLADVGQRYRDTLSLVKASITLGELCVTAGDLESAKRFA
jgi:hypothetical protein